MPHQNREIDKIHLVKRKTASTKSQIQSQGPDLRINQYTDRSLSPRLVEQFRKQVKTRFYF